MFHYVYKIHYGNAFYIGVRSCECEPEIDSYMGSGNRCLFRPSTNARKEILSMHETRELAEWEESRLIAENKTNIWCRNKKRSRVFKFGHV